MKKNDFEELAVMIGTIIIMYLFIFILGKQWGIW